MSIVRKIFVLGALLLSISLVARAQGIEQLADQLLDAGPRYSFIENKGQVRDQNNRANPSVKFILPLPNNNVVLRATGFSYDTYVSETKDRPQAQRLQGIKGKKVDQADKSITHKYHRVDVEFAGANPKATIISEQKSTEYIHYYTVAEGREVKVYSYGKVTYKEIYPGIDVEFIARPGENKPVEYNFIVHPGADMNRIQLRYKGANTNKLVDGKLEMGLAHCKLTESIPESYWEQSKEKETIRYKQIRSVENEITLGFENNDANRKMKSDQSLIIDPTPFLQWGTYYGGTADDYGKAIATDASGNVFVTGSTSSTNSIATAGAHQSTITGSGAFVVKFSSGGIRQWATYYAGVQGGLSIAIDASGNVLVTGVTWGSQSTSVATGGAHQTVFGGGDSDAFVVKFNSSGVRQWGTYYGGSGDDSGAGMTVDASGNVYLAGVTYSTTAIATGGSHQAAQAGSADVFLVKFNSTGVRQWGTYYGGSDYEVSEGICVDASGNIFMGGYTSSETSIASSGAHQTVYGGNSDAFVAKFNSSGVRQWGTYYGGSAQDGIYGGIATDGTGNLYISGATFSGSSIATLGAHKTVVDGTEGDAFLTKINSSGVRQWGTYYGGSGQDFGHGLSVDVSGNVFLMGQTASTNSIATAGVHQLVFGGGSYDAFIAKFNSLGARTWGTYYGGSGYEDVLTGGIASDAAGNVYITGSTNSNSSISTAGAHQGTSGGASDAFIAKFNSCLSPTTASELSCDICGGLPPSRCQAAGTTQFSSTITNSNSTQWTITDDNPAVSNVINTAGLVTWDPMFIGQAIITVTVSGCGDPVVRTKTISVTPSVSATALTSNISGSPPTRCQSAGSTQFNSTVSNASTAAWTITDDNAEVSNTISSAGLVTWSPQFNGQATITLTATGCGGPVVRTNTINVTPSVSATTLTCDICAGSSPSRCQGAGSTQLSSTINNALTTVWEITDNNAEISNTISPAGLVTWDPQFTGLATVTVTVTGCGGPVTQSKPITVNTMYTSPAVVLNTPAFVCPGVQAVFNPAITNGGTAPQIEFFINGSDTPQATGGSPTLTVTPWNYENASTVRCKVTNTDICISGERSSESLPLTVYTKLDGVVNILPGGPDTVRCQGAGSTQFTPSLNITNYTWSLAPLQGDCLITLGGLAIWEANAIGIKHITLSAQNCPSVKTSSNFVIMPPPSAPGDQQATACPWEFVTLKAHQDASVINWYNNGERVFIGDVFKAGLKSAGTHQYLIETVSSNGCPSLTKGTVQLTIKLNCDDRLNWIEAKTFDETGNVYGHSKEYFDFNGRSLQSQSKLFSPSSGTKVIISQGMRDRFDRVTGATLPAPVSFNEFNYHYNFNLNGSQSPYNYHNYDTPEKLYQSDPVGSTTPGTVGWYYSANNTLETNVPTTGYPYSRTEFYDDGTGEAKRAASPGDMHRLGVGHEALSGTFPVFQELDDYLTRRRTPVGIADNLTNINTLKRTAVQSVVRDENGNYAVSIADRSGSTVLTARQGTLADKVLTIINTAISDADPGSDNYRPITYFYLFHEQNVTITPAGTVTYIIEDMVSGKPYNPNAIGDSKWEVGFYKIILTSTSGNITLNYTNYYLDVSCQFYDDAGRLKYSVSPNGYKAWTQTTPVVAFDKIDKTEYHYNHQGQLLSMREPDAGVTMYAYRKDGNIRFSQNAKQYIDNTFSYTNYDKSGRPIESGQCTLNAGETFAHLKTLTRLEALENTWLTWTGTKKDWVKTHYDYPVATIPNLPASFKQKFVRAAVSWSENENITTWYSYDEQGKLMWMAQKPAQLSRTFVMQYTYGFLGNLLTVSNTSYFETSASTPFYHHYEYDADKRLNKVFTSLDGTTKKLRALYEYYLHGPLKRIELGDELQGIDFIYNIQGWLTQINHPDKWQDPGGDDNDAFGMIIDYYETALAGTLQASVIQQSLKPELFHKIPDVNEVNTSVAVAYDGSVSVLKDQMRRNLELLKQQLKKENGKQATKG